MGTGGKCENTTPLILLWGRKQGSQWLGENKDGVKWQSWGKPAVQTQRPLLCKKPQPCASCQGEIMCLCVRDSESWETGRAGGLSKLCTHGLLMSVHSPKWARHWQKPDTGPTDQSGHTFYSLPGPLSHVCPTPLLSIDTYNLEIPHLPVASLGLIRLKEKKKNLQTGREME